MSGQIQNGVSSPSIASYLFDEELDQKLDALRPKFELTLRELMRLCIDWSGGVPDYYRKTTRDERDLFSR
jgi:hypothetical protein